MKTYLPFNERRADLLVIWKEMFSELADSRELIWQLFRRDFLSSYKQSILGYVWAIVMPLVMVGAFVFLNRSGLVNIGNTSTPYPVYALAGLSVWQIFSSGLMTCTNSLVMGGGLITKINFPKETLVISALGQSIFEFIIRILLLAVVLAVYGVAPAWTVVFMPLAVIPIILFTIALGFIFSILNGLMRDIGNVLSLAVTFLLFLTPILYPLPASRIFILANKINVPGVLVTSTRDILLSGNISQPALFSGACIFSLACFIACWTIFHLVEPIITEKI
ncbi:MAG: ABC transporter permease [Elusimicrobiota bacterium]